MPFEDLKDWASTFRKPFYIAGPCSVESESQLRESIIPLIGKVDLFRGGIWKPRTRPGSFEGMGIDALKWLEVHIHIERQAVKRPALADSQAQ